MDDGRYAQFGGRIEGRRANITTRPDDDIRLEGLDDFLRVRNALDHQVDRLQVLKR